MPGDFIELPLHSVTSAKFSHMLLRSSTSRRTVWSQSQTPGNRPSSVWVEQSEEVYHSTTRHYARFGSSATVLVQHRSCQPHGVHQRMFAVWDHGPIIPHESPSDIDKDKYDYEAMTTHAFKQPEPIEYDCNAMNHHDEPHNCDPMYIKKKPSNMMIWTHR